MPQLGNFAALPRQDKLRFFYPFWAWIRLELFTGQRSRSGEICHRVFVVVNFIQRAGHDARSFLFVVIGLRANATSAIPGAALGSFFLSSLSPSTKKANIKRGPCIFFPRSRSYKIFFFQRQPVMVVFWFKKQTDSAVAGSRLPCTLTSIHWFHQFWSIETSDTTSRDVQRWSQWDSLWSFFSFDLAKTSGEQCRLTRCPLLARPSSFAARASIEQINDHQIVVELRTSKKCLNRWTKRPRWRTWTGETPETQAEPSFCCCLTERQNFQAAVLFPSLTWAILPLSCIISQEIMPLARIS